MDEDSIRNRTDASAKARNEAIKKIKASKTINTKDASDIEKIAQALIKQRMGDAYTAEGSLANSPTATAAYRQLYRDGLSAYKSKMANSTATPAEALAYATGVITDNITQGKGPYAYTSLQDKVDANGQPVDAKSGTKIFEGFRQFSGAGPTPMGDVRDYPPEVIKQIIQTPNAIQTELFFDKAMLQDIADKYKEDGSLSNANLNPIYRLADKLPKVGYLDLLTSQMELAGIDWDLPDALEAADRSDLDITEAVRRLGYKPNRTQSRIAEVGLGKQPDINTDLNSVQQQAIEVIASVESGRWGYNAVNQGTVDGRIMGSGSIDNIYPGMDLTQQTLGQVRAMQNETFAGSDEEWRASGGLWAVGKYQIIPGTLQGLMDRLNLSPDTLFSPALQDYLALDLLRTQGPGAWLGVMENGRVKISQAKYNILLQAQQMQVPNFGPAKWRQPDTLDPAVVEAYQNGL